MSTLHPSTDLGRSRRVAWGRRRHLYLTVLEGSKYSNTACDEAHLWLNGYVNKQNCRIWSEANPQVYAETPLHPEKLTVWGWWNHWSVLLQKR
ncbi:hypothetical protein TNCV_4397391 [Trichonephila clavipes]|nr:hypothetical protein TNCV_4397391 [Trichonephila clavipes]